MFQSKTKSMVKLDETDLRILAELEMDARISDTEMARKIDMSPGTVSSHRESLEQSGVIKGYAPRVDFQRLGHNAFRVYLKLQFVNRETEQKIIEYIRNSRFCAWFSHAHSRFDFAALFESGTSNEFYSFWKDFRKSFKPYIREAALVNYLGDTVSGHPFTKEVYGNQKQTAIGTSGNVKLDEKDREILKILSSNGRARATTIGKSLGLTSSAVKYRIDQLVSKKVIVNFRAFVDYEKLGYQVYKVDFNLDSLDAQEKMEQYLLKNPNVIELIRTSGWADIETRICTKSSRELYSLLHEFRDEFSGIIRDYDSFELPSEVKAVCTLGSQ